MATKQRLRERGRGRSCGGGCGEEEQTLREGAKLYKRRHFWASGSWKHKRCLGYWAHITRILGHGPSLSLPIQYWPNKLRLELSLSFEPM
jgi:hypothetical protein